MDCGDTMQAYGEDLVRGLEITLQVSEDDELDAKLSKEIERINAEFAEDGMGV